MPRVPVPCLWRMNIRAVEIPRVILSRALFARRRIYALPVGYTGPSAGKMRPPQDDNKWISQAAKNNPPEPEGCPLQLRNQKGSSTSFPAQLQRGRPAFHSGSSTNNCRSSTEQCHRHSS